MSALLYIATSVVVVWILVRLEKISWRAAAALILLPLCLTGRALLTGAVYGPVDLAYTAEPLASIAGRVGIDEVANPSISDVVAQFMPWARALRVAFAQHHWPLWNPFELCGDPLAGAVQSAPYHPVTVLGYLVPLPDAITFAAAMLYFIAVVGMFLLLLDLLGGATLPALAGAAGWMMSTHLLTFAGTAHAMSVALIPLILLGARRIVRQPGRGSTLLLGGALTLLLLAGHPESALHIVTFAVAYFLFELSGTRGAQLRRVIVSGLLAGFGTLLLCAMFLLPMFEAIPQTNEYLYRQSGYAAKSASAAMMLHRLEANFFPWLEGAPGDEEQEHDASEAHGWLATMYAGSVIMGPAIFAVFGARTRQRWFFLGAIVFGILAGISAPGLTHLFNILPGFSIAVNERMISFAALGVCALAAFGLDAWIERPRAAMAWSCFAWCVAIGIATWFSHAALPADYVRVGATRAILPLLLAGLAFLFLRTPRAVVFTLALILIQRTAQTASMQPTIDRKAFFPPFPGLEVMQSDAPFRIVGVGQMLPPGLSTHYGLEDARGFQAMTFQRMRGTYPMWSVPQGVWSNRVDRLDPPILSLMNVRFALVPSGYVPPPHWIPRATFPNYAVFENTRVLPRVFLPRVLHTGRSVSDTLFEMGICDDFAQDAWLEDGARADVPNGDGTLAFRRGRNGDFRIHAKMLSPGWIVVTNAAWKGWRAIEHGRELPLSFADSAFLAIKVGEGEHNIHLFYRPRSFVLGAWISGATALAIALALFLTSAKAPARP